MNEVIEQRKRALYRLEQLSLPLKDRDWKYYGSLDKFKKAYCDILTPFITKGIISKKEANLIYTLAIIEEKFGMPSEITGIKVLLKDDWQPTDAGSTLKFKVNKWCIYNHFAGGLNTLTIKTYK